MQIYGIEYHTPSVPNHTTIFGYELKKADQKFIRQPTPKMFDDIKTDAEGDPLYTSEQLAFINKELDKIERGFWFFNNGAPTYVTGLHYFYLQYWHLENGEAPDYRDADRRYFYFQDYCERQPYIDGIIRSKKRREGATSQATADLVKTAITQANAFCGLVSKTGEDAKDAFQKMVRPGFYKLPVYLKPRVEDDESKTELVFNRPKVKGKKNTVRKNVYEKSMGLGSKIDFKPTKLNSYDSGRITKLLKDEGGKDPADVPTHEYWPIVRETLKMGGKRVGFALLPSTSNKLTKGGRGFKILWDESNQFKSKVTASGLYRYFNPADDGYVPYIDEYGMSIRDKPTKEQAKWMKLKHGATPEQCTMSAREWLLADREKTLDESSRQTKIRQYPLNEKEAFDYEDQQNIYNLDKLADQKERIYDIRPSMRKVTFFRKDDGTVDWRDDPKGFWSILRLPEDAEKNAFTEVYGKKKPANAWKYTLVADPFKNAHITTVGSKGAGFVMSHLNPLDPENTGMPIAMYHGRPRLTRQFHREMLMCAEFYGADICYESDLDTYLEILEEENKMGYARERPKSTIDPNRRRKANADKKEYGVKSGDPFSYALMEDRSIAYVEYHCHKIWFLELIEQLELYDVEKRTDFDLVAAFQVGTVAISDQGKPRVETPLRKKPVLQTFVLKT